MRLLLDTHAFRWFITDDPKLSTPACTHIEDPANEVLLSAASHWEIAIKVSAGKLSLSEPFDVLMPRELRDNNIRLLPVELAHSAAVATLPFHHRDPFDRMLVAQAVVERIPIVSVDPAFDAYPVTRLW